MQIIVISGKQGSGKSTLASCLEFRSNIPFYKMRFAEPLYQMHNEVRSILKRYGYEKYDYEKKDGPLLQLLGTEWGRKLNENIWVELLTNELKKLSNNDVNVSVEDCRFENEFDALKKFPNVYTIRLECPTEVRKSRCSMWRENDNHPSETSLDNYASQGKFDLVIDTEKMSMDEVINLVTSKLTQKQVNT